MKHTKILEVLELLNLLDLLLSRSPLIRSMQMKTTELSGVVNALAEREKKIITEIEALKVALAEADVPQDAVDALANLEALIGTADDLNPDLPVYPPVE
jgi:hypothetical protein